MSKLALPTDHAQARAYLSALSADEEFTFQTLAEAESVDPPRHPPSIIHGSYDQLCDQLTALNQMGHGIFVMVNQGDLKGRKSSNVQKVRAHFVDLDGAPLDPVMQSDAPPHIVVESSPGRWHAYWLITDCPLPGFKERQKALAAKFGGDPAVCDLTRVLRVPGFWHLKAKPFQSRLIHPAISR